MHYLYKYVLDGEILYIGKSNQNTFDRIRNHGGGNENDNIPVSAHEEIDKADIFICDYKSADLLTIAESTMIKKYHPKYNKAIPPGYEGFTCDEPNWIPFKELEDITHSFPTVNQLVNELKMTRIQADSYRKLYNELYKQIEPLKAIVNSIMI